MQIGGALLRGCPRQQQLAQLAISGGREERAAKQAVGCALPLQAGAEDRGLVLARIAAENMWVCRQYGKGGERNGSGTQRGGGWEGQRSLGRGPPGMPAVIALCQHLKKAAITREVKGFPGRRLAMSACATPASAVAAIRPAAANSDARCAAPAGVAQHFDISDAHRPAGAP